ncbi:DgyrCDS4173 [Dimorphilus gyrociliatus]|uniref:DgyrCDS4173 n=1 Tax=Dimorphilus gyrociliatus TaxID=2664684 RepID=A0A7I8VHN2_9ANNE|nr:DgyrCDS4173 [Dimorphilus gyrociliatus]
MEKILRNENDISGGIENVAVPLEDKEYLKNCSDFVYSLQNIPSLEFQEKSWAEELQGCECEAECNRDTCSCVKQWGANYNSDRLLIASSDRPILECGKTCSCSSGNCQNKVVGRGVRLKLQVFKTPDKGMGVKCLESIKKGSFVSEYVGEVIGVKEAKTRTKFMAERPSYCCNYILGVREKVNGSDVDTVSFVDAMYVGNVSRFINHSCEPNLKMVVVRHTNLIPKIALYASRTINEGEELSFSYGPSCNKAILGSTRSCFCKTDSCSGYLPFDDSLIESSD